MIKNKFDIVLCVHLEIVIKNINDIKIEYINCKRPFDLSRKYSDISELNIIPKKVKTNISNKGVI